MSEWISVKDRIPKNKIAFLGTDGEIVFACYWIHDNRCYRVGGWENGCHFCGGQNEVSFSEENYSCKRITHWMPLPNPPKE